MLCCQTILEKISIKRTSLESGHIFLHQWCPLYRDSTVFGKNNLEKKTIMTSRVVLCLRLSGQFQASLFFFYEEILSVKKAPKRKINNFPPLRNKKKKKIVAFVVFCLIIFVLLVNFGL